MLFHLHHLSAADADQLNDFPGRAVGDIDRQRFNRFALPSVDLLVDHMGLRDGQFIAFAAHVFDQDGDMQDASSADFETVAEFLDAQSDVAFGLLEQTLPDVTAADEFSLFSEERRIVHAEDHGDGGFVDGDRGHGLGRERIRDRVADVDSLDSDDGAEIAAVDMIGLLAVDSLKGEHLLDGSGVHAAVPFDHADGFGYIERAAMDPADADSSDIVVVIESGDLHLERTFVHRRRRDAVDDGVHQGKDGVAFSVLQIGGGPAVASAGVKEGEIELFVVGSEIDEQIENIVMDLVRTSVRTVDLVDDDDRFEFEFQRLVEHETGLREGSFRGIDQQNHAVGHIENPFDLSAEVAVSRGVDDIDLRIPVADADVLGEDGDAPFAFQIVVVEEALVHFLIFAEEFGLFDNLVNKRGLPVVDMCDDGNVSDVLHRCILG